MVDAIYERSRYEASIDYSKPLEPALTPEQAAWLQQRLRPEATPTRPRTAASADAPPLMPHSANSSIRGCSRTSQC